jgi:DNA-binding response OmpR family regulator
VLSSEGIEVVDATDAAGAREALAGARVDLLLTARTLPDGDGVGLAHEARRQQRAHRIVLLSSGNPSSDLDDDDDDIDAVLAKPLRIETLLATVLGLLGDRTRHIH